MSISIDPKLEMKLRSRAESEGLTMEAYLERLIDVDQHIQKEMEGLALEGLNSGEPREMSAADWEGKHRLLEERLKKAEAR